VAVPGLKPAFDIHAKVKIGEKRLSQRSGKEYPAAVDYFVCDADEFHDIVGDKPSTILIRLVHDAIDDGFSTGLEWWKGKVLACYTKGQGNPPVALRVAEMKVKDGTLNFLDADDVRLGPNRGQGRAPIVCRARECPHFKADDQCKPMGRLVFTLNADPVSRVYELDTKSYNSIEQISGALRVAATRGSLFGRLFELSVQFVKRGDERFPVLSLREIADQCSETAEMVKTAEETIGQEKGIAAREAGETDARTLLALYFDHARPGWKDDDEFLGRFKERLDHVGGYQPALDAVMAR
jgi:hypothetical protein